MKDNHPVITLLGSNSGNNAGDAAILASILEVLGRELPGAEFMVPTHKPSFVNQNYSSKYKVRAFSFMPWTLSLRLIGLPTMRALAKSDMALICDGIIFDRKLWNPLFNWLINLIFLVPWCRYTKCRLVCYCTGIGPLNTKMGRMLARYLLNACDLIMMRDDDSIKLCQEIGVTKPVIATADAAFLNKVASEKTAHEVAIAEGIDLNRPLLGVNVTKYADSWLTKEAGAEKKDFVEILAEGIKLANDRLGHEFDVVVFSTHPMDESSAKRLAKLLNAPLVSNTKYLSHDLQAIMQRCQLFMGMRFHSLVLSSAVGAPLIGMAYMPKVKSYLQQLNSSDCLLELSTLSINSVSEMLQKIWPQRSDIRQRQQAVVRGLKTLALEAARKVALLLSNESQVVIEQRQAEGS